MPKITIDNKSVEAAEGSTILEAARQSGIEIPTLCFREGCSSTTSCMACIVKVNGRTPYQPACATKAVEGMVIESETEEMHTARRTALELLLSDHLGDCMGPCQMICPARMNIPLMIRQIATGQMLEAVQTVKRAIALPAVLGRICPAPCEKGCRRGQLDDPVAICLLKRYAADVDLACESPYLPEVSPESGKRVVIIGAGPAGLAAAYYLRQEGHGCTLFDANTEPGGKLRTDVPAKRLPRETLNAEIATITALGVELKAATRIPEDVTLSQLRQEFDAVLVATGTSEAAEVLKLEYNPGGAGLDKTRQRTTLPDVFIAGDALTPRKMAVWSVASGKTAAGIIDEYLRTGEVRPRQKPFNVSMGRLRDEELEIYRKVASNTRRVQMETDAAAGLDAEQAVAEALRCLHCDCRKYNDCKLRQYAESYNAGVNRYQAQRRTFVQNAEHQNLIYEPGKCIDCGLCIQIAEAAGEKPGLTFVGRGFDVRVAVPFNDSLMEALANTAAACVEACPTGALAFKDA